MAVNRGKQFEKKFKTDFLKIPGATIDRIFDTVSGYKSVSNICDFIGYKYPNILYAECKSIKGNTFPLSNLKQYNRLIEKKNIEGAITGVILWFIDHDKVLFVPITTFEKLKLDDKKSFNIKMINSNDYQCIVIPSIKKRTFLDSDYSVLFTTV